MSTRNPFRTLERVGRIIGYSILFAFFAFAVVAIGVQAAFNLGWWALLLIVAVPVGLVLIAVVAGLLRLATDSIHDAWLRAKWRWDDRHGVSDE